MQYLNVLFTHLSQETDLLKNLDPDSKVFCKLDVVVGYYQIPLDVESKKLLTFLLASSRYRYC